MKPATGQLFKRNQGVERHRLSQRVNEEQEKFLALAQAFYDSSQRTEKEALELTEAIITTIDNIIAAGDWEDSLFLRSNIKPLRQLKEEVLQTRKTLLEQQGMMEIQPYQVTEDEVKVYISLYQADGDNLPGWEAQLASIDCYMAGRPVYKSEADIKKAIRQKLLQTSEAYAVVVIKQSQLIENRFEAVKTDRYGHELVTLEAGIVDADKVIEFVHLGRLYHYRKNRLVLDQNK